MYIQTKMPVPAEYKNVVELIRYLLDNMETSKEEWVEKQGEGFVSVQTLYNILNYKHIARWPVLYNIATRLGAEVTITPPYPTDALPSEKK